MNLSLDQARALDQLETFVDQRRPPKQSFVLFGLAGTGKSTCLAELTRRHPGRLSLCAYTGKAASVLRRRVDVPVSTLHSVLYDFRGLKDGEPIFTLKGERLNDRVILVDECSMVSQRLALDLLDTGAKVIAAGDPGQLPPVKDTAYFTQPDATLTEIHRQALESPIIRQAHSVRNQGRYAPDGDNFQVTSFAEPEVLLAADAILCWRNRSRRRLNTRKRALLGVTGPLCLGEPLMCLRNDHRLGIYNGATYSVVSYDGRRLQLDDDGRLVEVELAAVEGFTRDYDRLRLDDDWLPFALGYASTVHKAQGSEWSNVLIFDECDRDWGAWMYTAITRAVDRCTVVRWRS